MIQFLKGKKTYLVAGLGALVTFAYYMGWISQEIYMALLGVLGFSGMATMRSAISNTER